MKKLVFAFVTIVLVACSSNKTDMMDVVSYQVAIEDEKLNLFFEFDSKIELPTKKFDASYKLLKDSIVVAILGSDFADYSDKKALKVYADSSYVEYKKMYDEIFENNIIEPTDSFYFSTDIKGNVFYYDSTIVSYQRVLSSYSGGVHGLTTKTNYVFDVKTGKQLTEEDVFGKGFERLVGGLLVEKANILREQGKLPLQDEFYNDWNIVANSNFALTDSSVIYTFNPYEIAPYCFGVIDIEILKTEIKTYY